jgi:hypothetical protein
MAISSNPTGLRPGVCTSTTRPTAPYEGQHIYETDTDLEYVWNGSAWIRIYVASTTTKGDIQTFSTVPTRLAVGTNGHVLRANSATATGLEWALLPFAVAAGGGYGGSGSTTITYPSGRFSVAPVIIIKNIDSTVEPIISTGTATSFTFANSVGSNNTFQWIAIQMTPSSQGG